MEREGRGVGRPIGPLRGGVQPSVYERLKQAIRTSVLPPGQPLVEAALADWCGVSRTPVREALTRLEQDGLVERGERGLIVKESSPEEILDIYETRIVLEATASRVAAERRTMHDLLRMRKLHKQMCEGTFDEPSEMAVVNEEFHRSIWRASHNASLIDLLERLSDHLGRYPATTLSFPGRWDAANSEHGRLIDAIDGRDAAGAAKIATEHFRAARDIRLRLWEEGSP